jgi:16S rRNA (adenine1518-N6/adenine1519-N6)-dimethyltransferase
MPKRGDPKAGRESVTVPSPFRPKKSLGQHFLSDHGVIRKIVDRSRFHAADTVLEVGPGRGELTAPLARRVRSLIAVEKDRFLADALAEKIIRSGILNVTVVADDILKFDFGRVFPAPPEMLQVIGNLPYNISSPFLEKLLLHRDRVGRAVLMFQLEMAERLTAAPGVKAYGALTLLVARYARATRLFTVPKEAFRPRPKVGSMVIELDFGRRADTEPIDEELFRGVVKGAFSHRRKTLLNSFEGYRREWDRRTVLQALSAGGIDPGRRAESLDMEEFLALTRAFHLTVGTDDGK